MKIFLVAAILVLLLQLDSVGSPFEYPKARESDRVDDYHGTNVADPYRWLEDPDSPESREWIEAENKITFDYLSKLPARGKIRERLTELWNYERFGIPSKEGNRYFLTRNDGLQNLALHQAEEVRWHFVIVETHFAGSGENVAAGEHEALPAEAAVRQCHRGSASVNTEMNTCCMVPTA